MSKTINMDLSVGDIKDTIKRLKTLSKSINKLSKSLPTEIAREGLVYLDSEYQSRYKDDNIIDISTRIKKDSNGCKIVSYGKDVIYEEFGTGDKGEQSPHPDKPSSLYAYNYHTASSGRGTIRPANDSSTQHGISSGLYWTYKKDGVGEVKYTQGVPAGKEMYNTAKYLKDTMIPKMTKEKVSDVISNI